MNSIEREDIASLPPKYRPMGAWSYFGYMLLFSIPLIGFICLIIFALDGSRIVRRSFARSYFCVAIIVLVVVVACVALGVGSGFLEKIFKSVKQIVG